MKHCSCVHVFVPTTGVLMIRKLYDNTIGNVTNTGATSDGDYEDGEDVSSFVPVVLILFISYVYFCQILWLLHSVYVQC